MFYLFMSISINNIYTKSKEWSIKYKYKLYKPDFEDSLTSLLFKNITNIRKFRLLIRLFVKIKIDSKKYTYKKYL